MWVIGEVILVVSDETALMNDLQSLSKITGMPADQLKILKSDFPLIKPSPLKADAWANAAEVMNLTVQQNKMQSKVDQAGVGVAAAGFLPTAQASGTASHNFFDSHTHSYAGTLSATYSFFSSGATLFSVRSAYDTYKADQFNIVQSERNARSLATQDYLSVLADIDQIAAYKEAILAGESAVQATFAGYKVGTETIVNLLQQQATLFQDQSLYANAIFSYIKDSITLKRDTGVLTANDMQALNSWLSTMTTSSASMLAQNQTPDSAKAE
ncbi:MAG: hypothetical protein EBX40_01445 [Gammaproteobacteria bacterium]|nr:hypothetical protein [Gammaproteobacteria bacterium]